MTWQQQEVVRLLKGQPGTVYQEASESEKLKMQEWLRVLLLSGEINVEFVKADGATRKMRCTLNAMLVPPVPVKEAKEDKPKITEVAPLTESVRVFDLDLQAWRSFRMDRLVKVNSTFGLAK